MQTKPYHAEPERNWPLNHLYIRRNSPIDRALLTLLKYHWPQYGVPGHTWRSAVCQYMKYLKWFNSRETANFIFSRRRSVAISGGVDFKSQGSDRFATLQGRLLRKHDKREDNIRGTCFYSILLFATKNNRKRT